MVAGTEVTKSEKMLYFTEALVAVGALTISTMVDHILVVQAIKALYIFV